MEGEREDTSIELPFYAQLYYFVLRFLWHRSNGSGFVIVVLYNSDFYFQATNQLDTLYHVTYYPKISDAMALSLTTKATQWDSGSVTLCP